MVAEGAPVVLKHMAFELAVRFAVELVGELLVELLAVELVDSPVDQIDH